MERKPYHHGNLEEALIEAGLSIVDKEGVEGMTLRRVAAACGVSHAAPYKHFSSKEELLTAMGSHVEKRFTAVLEASLEDNGDPDRMLRMAKAYISFFIANPHYFTFFQRQGDYRVYLNDLSKTGTYRPFEVFKQAAVKDLQPFHLPKEAETQTVIGMWAIVHGCTSISIMSGVVCDWDWAEMLGRILTENFGLGGTHFEQ